MQGGVTKQPDFEAVYARTFAPIKAKCLRLVSNPQIADDIAQEVFLRLWEWRGRPAFDAPDGARTTLAWLYRTSTRLAIDVLRSRRRTTHDPGDFARVPCGLDAGAAMDARAAVIALAGAARDDELQAAILCRVDGLSQAEAALVLDTSERTIRRLLDRFDERTAPVRKEFAT